MERPRIVLPSSLVKLQEFVDVADPGLKIAGVTFSAGVTRWLKFHPLSNRVRRRAGVA
ncbi:MAG: hypothetical protein M1398_07785 [Deltaproteobacteria bacterium]|nr:hypothetical protein [Deltaproteobacteria bacterium]